MTEPLLAVRGLRYARDAFTLVVDDWSVQPGEVVGLIGPNGAGKTTLLELCHGVAEPDEGTVRIAGFDPWRQPVQAKRLAGFAGEDQQLFPVDTKTMMDLLAPYYPTWDRVFARHVQERLGVQDDWVFGKASRGETMRMRLLAAIAFRPMVLLLDEPASGLDLGHRQRLTQTVLELAADGERAVVLSSHMISDVERIVDQLLVLQEGRVAHQGPVDELVGEGRTLEEAMVAWGVAG